MGIFQLGVLTESNTTGLINDVDMRCEIAGPVQGAAAHGRFPLWKSSGVFVNQKNIKIK